MNNKKGWTINMSNLFIYFYVLLLLKVQFLAIG